MQYLYVICSFLLSARQPLLRTETLKIKANPALCITYHRNIYYYKVKDEIFSYFHIVRHICSSCFQQFFFLIITFAIT